MRIFQAFSSDQSGDLTFDEFVDCFSHLHPRADKTAKMKAAFRMYDYDWDGLLGVDDVNEVLKALVGSDLEKYQLAPDDLKTIAQKVVEEADMDGSQYLGFTEFCKIMGNVDQFEANLTVNIV